MRARAGLKFRLNGVTEYLLEQCVCVCATEKYFKFSPKKKTLWHTFFSDRYRTVAYT